MSNPLNGLIAKRNDLTLTPENFPPLRDLLYKLAQVDAEEMFLLEEEDTDPEDPDKDPIDEDEDDEDPICSACNGSGEGMYDGSTCYKCKGYGHERIEKDIEP